MDCNHRKAISVIPGLDDLQIPCVHCECGFRSHDKDITCCNGEDHVMVLVPKHVLPILERVLGAPDEEPQQLLVKV